MNLEGRQVVSIVFAFAVGSVLCMSGARTGLCQEPRWESPPATITLELASEKEGARPSFLTRGFAWVGPIEFAMLRETVTIAAKHIEPGTVELVVKTKDAQVEIKPGEVTDSESRFNVRGKMPALDRQGAMTQARETIQPVLAPHVEQARQGAERMSNQEMERYLRQQRVVSPAEPEALKKVYAETRGVELGAADLRAALVKFARERPSWVSTQDEEEAKRAAPQQLLAGYLRLLQLRIAERHLQRCGVDLDTSRRNFEALILSKLDGVHAVMRGVPPGNEEAARGVRTLTALEMAGLKKALTVALEIQFFPATVPGDGNSQWFGAQRVACSARGAGVIRVHGRLSPPSDPCDWWTLRGYDPAKHQIQVAEGAGLRPEYFPDGDVTRLRIVSQSPGEIPYTLEIATRGTMAVEGVPIELHEAPVVSDAKFPY